MLISSLLKAKKFFTTSTNESAIDLMSSTFKYDEKGAAIGPTFVGEDEVMRPDLLADKVYANIGYWDALLKYNGVSNPFSLDLGEVLLVPSVSLLKKMIVPPNIVPEKGTTPSKTNEEKIMKPKSPQDKRRLETLRAKVPEVLPPNINLTGAQNVRVVDGKVIFGSNVTQSTETTQNTTLSRSRVQDQLKNNNNLI